MNIYQGQNYSNEKQISGYLEPGVTERVGSFWKSFLWRKNHSVMVLVSQPQATIQPPQTTHLKLRILSKAPQETWLKIMTDVA